MGRLTGMISGRARRIAFIVGIAVLAACAPVYRSHGFVPPEEDLVTIQPGIDTRATVSESIGQPTAGGVLNNGGFYYVRSKFRHFGPMEPQEIDREVVAITFDAQGIVRNIERYGLEDGRVVPLSRRVTDESVRDTTFLRQLMGNIGRFDASSMLGEP